MTDENALDKFIQQIIDCAFKPISGFVLAALDEIAQFVHTILTNLRQFVRLRDEL